MESLILIFPFALPVCLLSLTHHLSTLRWSSFRNTLPSLMAPACLLFHRGPLSQDSLLVSLWHSLMTPWSFSLTP